MGTMRKFSGPLSRIALAGVLIAGLLVLAVFLAVKGLAWASEFSGVAAFFLAAVVFLGPFIGRSMKEIRKPGQLSEEGEAAALKGLVRGEIARSDDRLKPVSSRRPLEVQWKASAQEGVAPQQWLTGSGRSGVGSDDICRIFLEFQAPKRIVLRGDAGAGKTILVTQVARRLLDHAEKLLMAQGSPQIDFLIPFYVSAAAWDPDKDLITWIADQLIRTNPELGMEVAPETGNRVADHWLQRKVLPVIDGLDELPLLLRAKAIANLNDRGELPVILATRPQEYADAVAAVGRPVSDSIFVDLHPLDIDEVKVYLLNTTSVIPDERWKEVFARLGKKTEDPLKQVLTNPLMLWLASQVYETRESFPRELADTRRFGDREAIEDHLLDAFTAAVYSSRKDSPRSRWTPEQAQRWLGSLAYHTARTRTPDIAWWRLAYAVRWLRPIGTAIRAVLLFGIVWWLGFWVLRLRPGWRHSFGLQALLSDGALGRQIIPLVTYLQDVIRVYMPNEAHFARVAVGNIPLQSLAVLEVWVGLVAVGAGTWSALRNRYPATLRTIRIRSLKSLGGVGISLAGAAAFAGLLWLGTIVLGHVIFRRNDHIVITAAFPVHSARILILAVIIWMLDAIPIQFIYRMQPHEMVSPRGTLRSDRHATFFAALSTRFIRALLIWLFFGSLIAAVYLVYVAISVTCRILLGGLDTASDRFADARVWLACSRRMPWRVMAFLADASDRGMLRRSGAVYQFRHIRLRQKLSAQHASLSRGLASVIVRIIRSTGPTRQLACEWSPESIEQWSEPFWAFRFKELVAEPPLRQRELPVSRPMGQIRNTGPGYAQAFTSVDDGKSWMICALPGERPVMVAASVWQGLREAASQAIRDVGADPGSVLTSVGLPAPESGLIHADVTRVGLRGGSWGHGRLMRPDERSDWRWEPNWSFKPYAGRFDSWEKYGASLRVSARVHFFWKIARLAIKPETYQARPDQLAVGSLPQAVTELWTRRGAGVPNVKWWWGGLSDKHNASLVWEISAPDKTPLMTGSFVLYVTRLTKVRRHVAIWSEVELRIVDIATWRDYLQAASGC